MKWLTTKEIHDAANESKQAAIVCSRKHWRQIYRATKQELLKYKGRPPLPNSLMTGSACALCLRYSGCHSCPLGRVGKCCTSRMRITSYEAATDALELLIIGDITLRAFREAVRPMIDLLDRVK